MYDIVCMQVCRSWQGARAGWIRGEGITYRALLGGIVMCGNACESEGGGREVQNDKKGRKDNEKVRVMCSGSLGTLKTYSH